MNIDIKTILPYIVIVASISMTWGMWSQRLDALETKVNSISQMQQDIAVIKEKIMWIEAYLIKEK
jgi:regulatory protein YycH of two-component signal transduction system YycFG